MSIINWPLAKWLDNVCLGALSSKETVRASYDLARNVIERGIPGDFVECGVFGGSQCAAMARAIMDPAHYYEENRRTALATGQSWPPRRVHLFDSFAGVPEPGPHDIEWIAAEHKPGQSICTLEAVKAHMTEWGIPDELLVYHPGLFADSLVPPAEGGGMAGAWWRGLQIKQIAILRLDGDLYESTRVCLEYLYPLVSPGGWIIIDDFNLSGARKAFLDYDGGRSGVGYFQKQP